MNPVEQEKPKGKRTVGRAYPRAASLLPPNQKSARREAKKRIPFLAEIFRHPDLAACQPPGLRVRSYSPTETEHSRHYFIVLALSLDYAAAESL